MFLVTDTVTEVIAHFIGHFHIEVEAKIHHTTYHQFWNEAAKTLPQADLLHVPTGLIQHLALDRYDGNVAYAPPGWLVRGQSPFEHQRADTPELSLPHLHAPHSNFGFHHGLAQAEGPPAPQFGVGPDEVLLMTRQQITLIDNDIIVLGSWDQPLHYSFGNVEKFGSLLDQAMAVGQPLSAIAMPNSVDSVPQFMAAASEAIHALSESAPVAGITIHSGQNLEGVFVDGALVSETPNLQSALPPQLRADYEGDAAPAPLTGTGAISITIDASTLTHTMVVEAGGNMMVNEALLVNASLTSTFLAVMGDYHSINAIFQTNAYSDLDTLSEGFAGATINGATVSHNLAVFEQQVRDHASTIAELNPDAHPLNWQISTVAGDVVFMAWMTQYSFTSDSDFHVLTATGTTTTITSGENVGLNGVNFSNIGQYYDLIIIGGSLYDGNFISQTNVLFDDDHLELLGGAQFSGMATSSGNLLWNTASITNIGATDWQSGIPEHYQQAVDAIGGPDKTMPGGFADDAAFTGFSGLRVLYIEGDVYDIRSITQVNVLGDADYVGVYQDKLLAGSQEVDWTISTGANALINAAQIIDFDSVGTTAHLGGQIYSDAILIQADILADHSAPDLQHTNGLANELIAFLDDDTIPGQHDADPASIHINTDAGTYDVMHSMLA